MSYAQTESVTVAVNASGAATAYTAERYTGVVRLAAYTKTDYADGSTFLITGETTGQTIWSQTGVNATASICPKQAAHTTAGAAALYASGGIAVLEDVVLVNERIKIVISGGGVSKTGGFRFVVA